MTFGFEPKGKSLATKAKQDASNAKAKKEVVFMRV
jgi:hypothetical protein